MGKIRIKTLGDETEEKKAKQKSAIKKQEKLAREKNEENIVENEKTATTETLKQDETLKEKKLSASNEFSDSVVAREISKPQKKEKFKKAARSSRYQTVIANVDRNRTYPLSESVELLLKLDHAKFDETVELHINLHEGSVSGNITLPHGTGKITRVKIADDALIAEIEKGIISFDVLVAQPQMMPKLARVAKVLGPKGLMPNPKNGTIAANPEDVVKKYSAGQMHFKSELKAPILHQVVGKISFGKEKLVENIQTMLRAIKKANSGQLTSNIKNITLKSTMSPGIKVDTNRI